MASSRDIIIIVCIPYVIQKITRYLTSWVLGKNGDTCTLKSNEDFIPRRVLSATESLVTDNKPTSLFMFLQLLVHISYCFSLFLVICICFCFNVGITC